MILSIQVSILLSMNSKLRRFCASANKSRQMIQKARIIKQKWFNYKEHPQSLNDSTNLAKLWYRLNTCVNQCNVKMISLITCLYSGLDYYNNRYPINNFISRDYHIQRHNLTQLYTRVPRTQSPPKSQKCLHFVMVYSGN
jgi:hypothetical protein